MAESEAPAAGADAATPAAAAPKTTTGGAVLFQSNVYLTAAVVALYSTRALWVKLRHFGLGKRAAKGEVEVQDSEPCEDDLNGIELIPVEEKCECQLGEMDELNEEIIENVGMEHSMQLQQKQLLDLDMS